MNRLIQQKVPRVALLVETSRKVGRDILRGVVRYERLHGPWGLHVMPGDLDQTLPAVRAWGGTGIIARISSPEIAGAILKSGLPTIAVDLGQAQLLSDNPLSRLSELYVNSEAVGRMAAEHLLERQLLYCAFVPEIENVLWSQRRERGFCERLAEAGLACTVYKPPPRSQRDWGLEQQRLAQWLQALPKPTGLFAAMDVRGRQVLDICLETGISVPEEIALIGVDNDELLCELSEPPMSSVALDAEQGGYEAAALLDGLMSGRLRRPRRILIQPTHVAVRQSTDVLAVEDELVKRAVQFVRLHAGEAINVGTVIKHLGVSRRVLELRFRRAIDRSIHDEIMRVQLERVKMLLHETAWPLPRIAEASGFGDASYLVKVFRRYCGVTPNQFRQRSLTAAATRTRRC